MSGENGSQNVLIVAVIGVVTAIATFLGTRLRERSKGDEERGITKERLQGLVADIEEMKTHTLPDLRQDIRRLEERVADSGKAVQGTYELLLKMGK